jgi:hypothetical protein
MPPEFGDGGDIELEFLLRAHQRKTLGQRLHHAVLDAVVNHLGKVPGPGRPGMQPAGFRRRRQHLQKGFQTRDIVISPPAIRQ